MDTMAIIMKMMITTTATTMIMATLILTPTIRMNMKKKRSLISV